MTRLLIVTLTLAALFVISAPRVTADLCSSTVNQDQAGPFCIDGIIPDQEAGKSTTLTANVNNSLSTTTMPVASTTGFAVNDHILIDQEKMRITAVPNSTSLTVVRAQLDTSRAAHLSGAKVTDLKAINNDPSGSNKELGPVNGKTTKVNVANTCIPPGCLEDTNPNGQVDLNTVWLKGLTGTGPGGADDLWLYYAWARDANSGSGFLSIELNRLAAPDPECDYDDQSEDDLKAECNPFANRRDGDILLLWDQQGNSRDVYLRVFVEDGTPNHGGAFGPPISLTDEDSPYFGAAFARYGNGGFRGEMAVDLSFVVDSGDTECESFANAIPGTVTGNSDEADYKDVVLKKFPLISNCGGLKIVKDTNPDGGTGTFPYVLTGGTTIFPDAIDSDCDNTSTAAQCNGSLVNDDAEVTIEGLLSAADYTLSETPPSDYTLTSISCVLGTAPNQTTYNVYPGGQTFSVVTGQTTVCTITNTLKTGTYRVKKVITPGFGLTATCPQFQFKVDSGSFQAWDNTCQTDFTFAVGTQHSAVEDTSLGALPTGFVFDSASAECTNGTIVANSVTTCTITNKATPANPLLGTAQRIILHDRAKITGIRRGSDDDIGGTNQSTVTFMLFTGSSCAAGSQVGTSQTVAIDFPNATTTEALVGTSTGFDISFNGAGASGPHVWSWKAVYNGNAFNNATPSDASACNETITVSITGNTQIQ